MKNKKKKRIIDLRRFIQNDLKDEKMYDENGSYTGLPAEYYYDGISGEPVQDADDL